MSESDARERDRLLYQLGLLVDPVRRLFSDPDYRTKLPYIEHRFRSELDELAKWLANFCQTRNIAMTHLHTNARNAIYNMQETPCAILVSPEIATAQQQFDKWVDLAFDSIRALPVEMVPMILPERSPFSTYLAILPRVRAARKRVEIFDPYLDKEVFDRYLAEVPTSIAIVAVTDDARMTQIDRVAKTAVSRDRIVAVSELLAIERPSQYRLVVAPSLHDRYLRVDDYVFHLGGSLKDAGKADPFTITSAYEAGINQKLDDILAKCVEWFGPTVTIHRKA